MFVAWLIACAAPAWCGGMDPACARGVFVPTTPTALRGRTVSFVQITGGDLRVYFDEGGCFGPLRIVRGRLKARADRCLVDAGEAPAGCCGPFVVRLSVDAGCTTLSGSIRRGAKRSRLVTQQGTCGDGIQDEDNGEECDGSDAFFCSPGACDASCRCSPRP
jgi:hypothetical protein